MLKKTVTIVFFLCLAIALYFVYDNLRPPEGIDVKGDSKETVAWLTLGAAVVSLLASLVGLVQKLLELKNNEK